MPTIPSPKMPAGTGYPASNTANLPDPTVKKSPLDFNLVDHTAKFINMGSNPK